MMRFDLSADRANVVRQILEREGLPAQPYLRGLGQGGQPAAVSGRSVARGQSARDHHLDARGSAVAAEFEALRFAANYLYYRDWSEFRRLGRAADVSMLFDAIRTGA